MFPVLYSRPSIYFFKCFYSINVNQTETVLVILNCLWIGLKYCSLCLANFLPEVHLGFHFHFINTFKILRACIQCVFLWPPFFLNLICLILVLTWVLGLYTYSEILKYIYIGFTAITYKALPTVLFVTCACFFLSCPTNAFIINAHVRLVLIVSCSWVL